MSRPFTRMVIAASLLSSAVIGGLVGSAPAAGSTVVSAQASFSGDGDFIAGNRSWFASTPSSTFTASMGSTSWVDISWSGQSSWSLWLIAPQGESLTEGTYRGATRAINGSWRPELAFSGDGRGCNTLRGSFVIHQIAFDDTAQKNLLFLDVSFVQHCGGGSLSTKGRVTVNLPISAPPAPLAPGVTGAQSVESERGKLLVTAQAPAGVTSLTARLYSVSTGLEVASTSSFTRIAGNDASGTWVTDSPFGLAEQGSYRVDTDLVDSAGTTTTQNNVGYLTYETIASLSAIILDPPTPSSATPTVTLSGVLSGIHPLTQAATPVAGATVRLFTNVIPLWGSESFVTATTAADGSFSAAITFSQASFVYVQYLGQHGGWIAGTSTTTDAGIKAAITLNLDKSVIAAGEPLTISGLVTKETSTGWQPDAGATVWIEECPENLSHCPFRISKTTDASGAFSITTLWHSTGQVKASSDSLDPFVLTAVAQAPIRMKTAPTIALTGSWLDRNTARFTGSLAFDQVQPTTVAVQLQYRWHKSANWATMATVNALWDGSRWRFSGDVLVTDIGEWRAAFDQTDAYFSATSPTIWTWCNCRASAPRRNT